MPDYTVKFPLEFSNESNGFEPINEEKLKELVFFNLKNIILTNPGERIFNPLFGVGIKRYLFEQESLREDEIKFRIKEQIRLFADYVIVKDLELVTIDNTLQIILKFEVKKPKISEVLILDIVL